MPTVQGYDPEVHLSLTDVAIDSHTTPSVVRLCIKQSKTDPLRQGVDIFLGTTGLSICPVQAIISFLAVRSPATYAELSCNSPPDSPEGGRSHTFSLYGPQLPYWGGYYGSQAWFGRWAVEEHSLFVLY